MAKLTVFEIRTQRDGVWKIDSVFDERDLAVNEAQRVEQTRRFAAVLVVEETYVEETERTNTRTIYRSSKEQEQQPEAKDSPSPEVLEELRRRRRRRGPPSPLKKSVVRQLIGRAFILAVIAGVALGLVYFLNVLL